MSERLTKRLFKSSKKNCEETKKENQHSGYIKLLNLEYMEYMRIENQDLMVRENQRRDGAMWGTNVGS